MTMQPKTEHIFIGNIVPDFASNQVQAFSFAAQYYQEKVVKAFHFDRIYSINYIHNKTLSHQMGPITYLFFNKKQRLASVLMSAIKVTKNVNLRSKVVFYNLNYRTFILLEFLKLFRRCECYVIVADYEKTHYIASIPRKLLQILINRSIKNSHGVLALNKNINIHKNTVYQEALISNEMKTERLIQENQTIPNLLLFSGSIGFATGIDIAIKAMRFLPGYRLFISGSLYDISQAELLGLIEQNNIYNNIEYLAELEKNDYLCLLAKCEYGLSLRNVKDPNHLYNFPSKIGEYLSFNKKVISTLNYEAVNDLIYIADYSPEAIALKIEETKFYTQSARDAMLDRFGFQVFNQNLSKLMFYK